MKIVNKIYRLLHIITYANVVINYKCNEDGELYQSIFESSELADEFIAKCDITIIEYNNIGDKEYEQLIGL